MKRQASLGVCGALIISALTSCTGSNTPTNQENDPARWPQVRSAVQTDPGMESRIDALLASMTDEQKVGQLIQPELRHITPEQVKEYHIGSVLNGGGSYPNGDKYASVDDWLALADGFYEASMDTSDGGVAIPVMWATDAVHGHNNVVGATLFPHNIGLGATRNTAVIRQINEVTAREVAVTGIDWNFSPTLAVARDDRWGRTYEAYAEAPELVEAYGGEAVTGLQGRAGTDDFMGPGHVLATAKHFIADGGTLDGVDRGDAAMPEQALRDIHGPGYFSAIEAGVQTVMASFSSWNGEKLHGHRYLLTDVLKGQMGFDGLVVGDWNGHEFVDGCSRDSCPHAINAGLDIFMAPDNWQALYRKTLAQVRGGEISQARLNDAVRRILRVKLRAGLFDKGRPSERRYAGRDELLGAPEHRAVARQAVRESLVLLKNNRNLLPLKRDTHVLVAGDGAHNVAKQAGGWSVTWQGTGTSNADFPGATSIYQGIAEAVKAGGGSVELDEGGHYEQIPDVAVVVFGEDPYAEMQGDTRHLDYPPDEDLALLRRLKADGIPTVSLFLTGRPLWVNPELNASDAFVVAWLPGTEGAGVADVIFRDENGGVHHDFTGTLPFSWPASAEQSPLNVGQDDYKPLFEYGYGLTYDDQQPLAPLSEDSGLTETDVTVDLDIFKDRPMEPWELVIGDASRGYEPVTGSSARLPGIEVESVDRNVQEDSRRLRWTGASEAQAGFYASQRTDLSAHEANAGALMFDVQANEAPTAPVQLGMSCGQDCGGQVEVTQWLHQAPADAWQSLSVDLSCFAQQGADLSLVLVPFYLASAGELNLALHHVRVTPDKEPDIRCD